MTLDRQILALLREEGIPITAAVRQAVDELSEAAEDAIDFEEAEDDDDMEMPDYE